MFLSKNPTMSGLYWQAVKDYKWRVLRLSVLLTVLVALIVATIPSTYLGTARLQFLPHKTAPASSTELSVAEMLKHRELTSNYDESLLENIAKNVLTKLKKITLSDVDSELEKAISVFEFITEIKQTVRTAIPFMPQHDPEPLSAKQLAVLKNHYTLEQIKQNLQLVYSSTSTKGEVSFEYKDRSAPFALIIATLAADLYLQSVNEINMQISQQVQQQNKSNTSNNAESVPFATTANTNIQIGNYETRLLKPNRTLIVSLSFLLSVLLISSLVLLLVRIQEAANQKNQVIPSLINNDNSHP